MMIVQCLHAEWLKLRHSRFWYILIILPIISTFIGSINYYFNQGILQNEWYSLWSQVSLFYGEFFFPILIAICCSLIWRLEHFNKNWNLLMTMPVSLPNIYLAKLFTISLMLLFVQGVFFLLYVTAGAVIGFSTSLPKELFGWLIRGWFAGVAISALQLTLSMVIRSFAIPIGISLCASFIGLGLYVLDLGIFFPHSLLTLGMSVISQTGLPSLMNHIAFFLINLFYIIISFLFAMEWMRKKDVFA